jgi:membrane protease YdiL (CAAX protease family)
VTSFEQSVPPPSRPELPEGLPAPDRRRELPHWPAWAPFAAMLIALGIAILGVSVIALVAGAAGTEVTTADPPPGVTIAGTFIQDFGLIFSAVLIAQLTAGRPTPGQFGLRRVGLWRATRYLGAAWGAFFVFSALWAAALHVTQNDDLPQELGADDSTTALVAVAVLVCVLAPIAEELFFRGFCFTALRRWIGLVPGALATGVIFGLIHAASADAVFLVPLAFFGMALCFLYERTGSLLPCMVLHALNNALALAVSQGWSVGETAAFMAGSAGTVLAIALSFTRAARPRAVAG